MPDIVEDLRDENRQDIGQASPDARPDHDPDLPGRGSVPGRGPSSPSNMNDSF